MVAEIHALAPEPDTTGRNNVGVLRLTRKKDAEPEKRVVVFYIDDEAYSVPAHPGAEIGLKMLQLMETRGQEAATYYMLVTMLGEDGYRALMEYKNLPPEAMKQVVDKINEIANGAMEGPKAS